MHGPYIDRSTFEGLPVPAVPSALPPLQSPAGQTLVMRIIEWFDMMGFVKDGRTNTRILSPGGGSCHERGRLRGELSAAVVGKEVKKEEEGG
jgi:hypothetical protein